MAAEFAASVGEGPLAVSGDEGDDFAGGGIERVVLGGDAPGLFADGDADGLAVGPGVCLEGVALGSGEGVPEAGVGELMPEGVETG